MDFGGRVRTSAGYEVRNDLWLLSNGVWTQKATGPSIRYRHAAALVGLVMYVHGGFNDPSTILEDLWSYDRATNGGHEYWLPRGLFTVTRWLL